VGALLVVRLDENPPKYFAFAFGFTGRFLLRDDGWHRGYGLRVALNLMCQSTDDLGAVPVTPLIGISSKQRGSATIRAQRQATRSISLDEFSLDRMRDVVNAATGRPLDTDKWGTRITGGDAFHFSTEEDFGAIGELCRDVEALHDRVDYRTTFAMVDHIQPVTEPSTLAQLEGHVIDALRRRAVDEFDLAPPEVVNWELVKAFRFHFDGRRHETHPDLLLRDLLHGMHRDRELATLDVRFLKTRRILALGSDNEVIGRWTIWRCLASEFTIGDATYILDEGEFFHVEALFLSALNAYIDQLSGDAIQLPASAAGMIERDYNAAAVGALGSAGLLLDRKLVKSPERDRIELCDILTKDRQLIHVKRHLGSSDLSHLFAQGAVSAELLQESQDFCSNAQEVINTLSATIRFPFFESFPVATRDFEIVYAIIAPWRDRTLAAALPFFSKLNLRARAQELRNRGFRVSCVQVMEEAGT
jgi:uncharacterized protein (TIGR04141 family)